MIVSIYENTEDGTECYVAMASGDFAPLTLSIAEKIPGTVWELANKGTYTGVKCPRAMGRILFQIIDGEGTTCEV